MDARAGAGATDGFWSADVTQTDWVASVGVSLLLLAFILNQRGTIGEHSASYLWLNLLGAAVAGLASWMGGILPFVFLECIWAGVAGWGLVGLLRGRTRA
jgi:hypothetical protein